MDEAEVLAKEWFGYGDDDLIVFRNFAVESRPLLACYHGDDLVALGGAIPQAPLGMTGFLWMESTGKHPLTLARVGPRILRFLSVKYSRMVGTCSLGPRSEAWLKSIGAKFDESATSHKPFEFGAIT